MNQVSTVGLDLAKHIFQLETSKNCALSALEGCEPGVGPSFVRMS